MMSRVFLIAMLLFLSLNMIEGQDNGTLTGKSMIGFSGVFPTGIWPATALTNMGSTSFLEGQGHDVKRYGFGLVIQRRIVDKFHIFFDINTYNYNIALADKGEDVQSVWTVQQSAEHWDEPGAPQILYVNNLPADVHFDMQATGFRLGGKYYFIDKKVSPWAGLAYGFYEWEANYFNEDKTQTYGYDRDFEGGLTFLFGVDFTIFSGVVLSVFADLASPVAAYQMEGLFYPQWDIEYSSHIMGTNRFGLTLSFVAPGRKGK